MNLISLFQKSRVEILTIEEKAWLAEQLRQYPYFALLHYIKARNATLVADPKADQLRSEAAIFAADRKKFAEYLDEKLKVALPKLDIAEQPSPTPAQAVETASVAPHETVVVETKETAGAVAPTAPVSAPETEQEIDVFSQPLQVYLELRTPRYLWVTESLRTQMAAFQAAPSPTESQKEQEKEPVLQAEAPIFVSEPAIDVEKLEIEFRNRRRLTEEELEAMELDVVVHDETNLPAAKDKTFKNKAAETEILEHESETTAPTETTPNETAADVVVFQPETPDGIQKLEKWEGELSLKRFIQPEFTPKSSSLHNPPRTPWNDEPQLPTVDEVLARIQSESFKRFVEPDFAAKPETLNAPPDFPETTAETQPNGLAEKISSESFQRFVEPTFDAKPETLNAPPDFPETTAETQPNGLAEKISSESFQRFVTPTFDAKPETLNAPPDFPETTAETQPSGLAEKISSESFQRFVEPTFDAKPETLNAPSEHVPETQPNAFAEKISSESFQRFVEPTFDAKPETLNAPSEHAPETQPNAFAEPEDKEKKIERLQSESMRRFVEPNFLPRSESPATKDVTQRLTEKLQQIHAAEGENAPANNEALRSLTEKLSRIQSDSMKRFVEPTFDQRISKPGEAFEGEERKGADRVRPVARTENAEKSPASDSASFRKEPTILESFREARLATEAGKRKAAAGDESPKEKTPRVKTMVEENPEDYKTDVIETNDGRQRVLTQSMKRFINPEFDMRVKAEGVPFAEPEKAGKKKMDKNPETAPVSETLSAPEMAPVAVETPQTVEQSAAPTMEEKITPENAPEAATNQPVAVLAAQDVAVYKRENLEVEIVFKPEQLKYFKKRPIASETQVVSTEITQDSEAVATETQKVENLATETATPAEVQTETLAVEKPNVPEVAPETETVSAIEKTTETAVETPPETAKTVDKAASTLLDRLSEWGVNLKDSAKTSPEKTVSLPDTIGLTEEEALELQGEDLTSSESLEEEILGKLPEKSLSAETPSQNEATETNQPPAPVVVNEMVSSIDQLIEKATHETEKSKKTSNIDDILANVHDVILRKASGLPPKKEEDELVFVAETAPQPNETPQENAEIRPTETVEWSPEIENLEQKLIVEEEGGVRLQMDSPEIDKEKDETSYVEQILTHLPEDSLINPFRLSEKSEESETGRIEEKIERFRENLSRMRTKSLQDPTEVTLQNIQRRFLDSVVNAARPTPKPWPQNPAPQNLAATEDFLTETPEDSPAFDENAGNRNIEDLLARFRSFEPTIFSQLGKAPGASDAAAFFDFHIEEADADAETLDPRWATETLAQVFQKQGDRKRAIQIYKTLMQKHPEKMETYEAAIQAIDF